MFTERMGGNHTSLYCFRCFNLIFSTHCYNKSHDEELVRIHIHFQGELGRLLKTTFQERKTKCHLLMEIRYVHRICQMYLPIGYIFQQVIQLVTYICQNRV